MARSLMARALSPLAVVKGVGWRRAPGVLWRTLRTGRVPSVDSTP